MFCLTLHTWIHFNLTVWVGLVGRGPLLLEIPSCYLELRNKEIEHSHSIWEHQQLVRNMTSQGLV